MMEYFSSKKAKKHQDVADKGEEPVLNDEDEAFLQRIASEGTPPPLPERPQDLPIAGETQGNNAQIALMAGAQNIPLPDVPDTPDDVLKGIEGEEETVKGGEKGKKGKKAFKWSFLRRDSRDSNRKSQDAMATDLHSAAEGLKAPGAQPNEDGIIPPHEAHKEEEEMTRALESLNLAAVNNRVFSISKESQELLRKFTLVLKDLVNGVPTAYDDLESLLTNSEHQLQRSYKHLPSFLQKLIEQLPSKFTQSIGPEMLAAAAEKQGLKSKYMSQGAGIAEKMGMRVKVPSLKDLVTKPGAIAGMLRAIMNFLKLRFPAFLGMNVLWSLALFVLLFVFWYCHKRGRESRLEKERLLTESEIAALEADIASDPGSQSSTATGAPYTTTAAEGATLEQVRTGMQNRAVEDEAGPRYAEGGSLAKEYGQGKEKGEPSASAASHTQTNFTT
ncbi:hypothetical protein MMC08_007250 [Hypocenomyce scalaris]|nr:hypothetical protein [Hypocenomyce scalaris]